MSYILSGQSESWFVKRGVRVQPSTSRFTGLVSGYAVQIGISAM
jgi:hypothetical protein